MIFTFTRNGLCFKAHYVLQVLTVDLCCDDYINVYDGTGLYSNLLLTITRGSGHVTAISSGQSIYVHMSLRQHWSCTGVLMRYTLGNNFLYPSVSLLSPITKLVIV